MEIVIDAQVVNGYFKETVLEIESPLTDKATLIFDRVGSEDQTFLDSKGIIEHEWRNVVEPEWFDVWYARLLQNGAAVQMDVSTCYATCRQLERNGFPRSSRDIWYVRTAKAVVDRFSRAVIVTEDMDFFDPRQKGANAKQRKSILLSGNGQIARYLHKKEKINVKCVAGYLKLVDSD
jgi:hypothetical protein